jgi:hypothetical protein
MAGAYNIAADQGATWSEVWTWLDANNVPVNLTGYTAKLDWATAPGAAPVLALTEAAGIALGGALGTITPTATAAQTSAVAARAYLYDLFLTSPGGVVTRLLAGQVLVTARVTP